MLGAAERYEMGALLGEGGMGRVFRAHDRLLDRTVAIKTLSASFSEHPDALARLKREGMATTRLAHPHIVSTFEVLTDLSPPQLVMEYVDGRSLDALLEQEGPLSEMRTLQIARDVADGLAAVHELGLVHRDIKPANVLIDAVTGRAKVADFGLVHTPTQPGITRANFVIGTPEYMAPERFRASKTSASSDVYSLGAMMVEMLTGEPPVEGTPIEIAVSHATGTVTRPPLARVSSALRNLILCFLEREAPRRPDSCVEAYDALVALAPDVTGALANTAICAVGEAPDLERVHASVADHGGSVGQCIGGDLIVAFAAPEACFRWAREYRQDNPGVRAALTYGPAEMGEVISGDCVGRAARTMRLARTGDILVEDAMRREVGAGYWGHLEDLGSARLVGQAKSAEIYRVRRSSPDTTFTELVDDEYACGCGHTSVYAAPSDVPVRVSCRECGRGLLLEAPDHKAGAATPASSAGSRDRLALDHEDDVILLELGSV